MIRKIVVVLGTLGVFAFGIAVISVMGALRPEPERKPPEARTPAAFVQEVAYEPVSLSVYAQGEVRPRREIALTTQVGGRIVSVSPDFVDGGVIEEGEVLVRLEDADYRSAVTRSQARVAAAEQALAIEKAEAELALRDFKELSGTEAAPSALTLRRPQLAAAQAEYDAARADLTDARLALKRTRIVAPYDGRVRSISADVGQFVGAGAELGRVFSTDVAEVRLPLTDADLARLDLPFAFEAELGDGPVVHFSADVAGKRRQWDGHVVRTDAAIDPGTRQIAAIAQVQEPYGTGADDGFPMAIGLFVDAEIEGPTIDRAIVLPRLAVDDGNVVYTLAEDDTVERTPVELAAFTPAGAIVIGGLEEGQRVVVSRLPTSVGKKVRPLTPGAVDANEEPVSEGDRVAAGSGGSAVGAN